MEPRIRLLKVGGGAYYAMLGIIDGSFEQSYHPTCMTELTLTAIFEEADEGGYIGYVAELPGANTQGDTLEETRENLSEAIQLILNSNRETV